MMFQIETGLRGEITGIGGVETGTVKGVQSGVVETGGLPGQIGAKHHALRMSRLLRT